MERVSYGVWPNCCRLANGQIEVVATTDVGPRIIRLAFLGGENEFAELPEMVMQTGGRAWHIYGGHRLWHSPEAMPRSYSPDDSPIEARTDGDTLRLIQPVEPQTGIQKEMAVALSPAEARVRVTHRLRNAGPWPVEMAAWALSVMAPGGFGIAPQSQRSVPHNLLPNRVLVLWPYTDPTDPRLMLGSRYLRLRQDPERGPIKVGLDVDAGWCAHARRGHLFLKRFAYQDGARYPDCGCSVEMYTNEAMLELETLGPLRTVAPGETIEHVEEWRLFRDVDVSDEGSVERNVLPLVEAVV
ncbi:MAG: hypothetical protein HY321_18545 [Armatimonadetes bacterium]|nr:hypothetical protein [Armatimonadota bacterium]